MDHAKMVETATRLSIEYAISYDDALRRLKYLETIDAEWAHRISALETANAELKAEVERLKRDRHEWKVAWKREVQRGVDAVIDVLAAESEAERLWGCLFKVVVDNTHGGGALYQAARNRDLPALERAIKGE